MSGTQIVAVTPYAAIARPISVGPSPSAVTKNFGSRKKLEKAYPKVACTSINKTNGRVKSGAYGRERRRRRDARSAPNGSAAIVTDLGDMARSCAAELVESEFRSWETLSGQRGGRG
jgi:hypothetical protein